MKTFAKVFLLLLMMALPAALRAQPPATGDDIAIMFHLKPKAGMANQFAAALQAHAEWRRANSDPMQWVTMQVVSGRDYGDYYIRAATTWAGLDEYSFRDKGSQHFLNSVDPFLESIESWITADRADLSHWPDTVIPRLIRVETFKLDAAKEQQFWGAVAKAHKAFDGKMGYYSWSMVVDGRGFGTDISLVIPGAKWADFKPKTAEMMGLLNAAYGPDGTAQLFSEFADAAQPYESLTVEVRPSMSVLGN